MNVKLRTTHGELILWGNTHKKKLHISVVYPKILPKGNYLQKNIDGISNFDKEVIIGLVTYTFSSLGSNYANEKIAICMNLKPLPLF